MSTTKSTPANGLSLGFVGDLCLSLDVINTVRKHGVEFLFERVRPLYEQLDLVVGNLESCITDNGPAEAPLRPPLNTPTDVAEALKSSGINVFGLANNHVMDFGAEGLRSTIDYLGKCGFRYFGAGMTMQEAEAPLEIEIAGTRLAFLGACEFTACWASDDRPGVAPLSNRRLLRRVAEAKKRADLVIVVLHADLEFVSHPAPWRQRLSRRLIEEGAALVVQHHPHVCQGIEQYGDGLIAYSLGNHVFQVNGLEYFDTPGTGDSLLLEVNTRSRGAGALDWKAHHLYIDPTHRPVPCEPNTGDRQRQEFETLSRKLLQPRVVRAAWRSTCRQQVYENILGTYYTMRKKGIASAIEHDMSIVRTREHRRWIYGFLSAGFR
jgi:poly-gamma-glutamate synthesis protein (capsule biosynthesis protein)